MCIIHAGHWTPNPNPNPNLDLWPNIHSLARYRDGLRLSLIPPCAKFGDFSFSRFRFIVRTGRQTDRITEADQRTRLPSAIQVRYRKGPRDTCRTVCAIALHRKTKTNTNPIILTLTDTGGAVLTLMLEYRSLGYTLHGNSGPLR